MLKKTDSTQQSTEILKQTIKFMGEHRLAAVPVNYTVCYEYFRGDHLLLSQAIDKAITDKQPLTSQAMQVWFDTFLLGYDWKDLNQSQFDLIEIANQRVKSYKGT